MKILMVTNTYTPIVGGVERSIKAFTQEYKRLGHQVLIVAPEFDNMPRQEEGVIRLKAIRRFNGSDFSVRISIPLELNNALGNFKPDIVHSHHPFLLGDTALRIAKKFQIPLVFTHHTKYEDYTHYLPFDSEKVKTFVVELASGYAELADQVFVPSKSIADLLSKRGIKTSIEIIPTGIELNEFKKGDRESFRKKSAIPDNAFVIGHVGRLAPEKNLKFLVSVVLDFLSKNHDAYFLLVGYGILKDDIIQSFKKHGLEKRLIDTGILEHNDVVSAYKAMDVFIFSSKTETQGVVLAESMAAGVPVVALDASGVREILKDKINGRLLFKEDHQEFIEALHWIKNLSNQERDQLKQGIAFTAQDFSMEKIAQKALGIYKNLNKKDFIYTDIEQSIWAKNLTQIKTEWELLSNLAESMGSALKSKTLNYEHAWIVRLKRFFNGLEWSARLMGLSSSQDSEIKPGLVLIQIDGFSFKQIKNALREGRMPFLQKLLKKERYELYPFYSGQPSSTPGVQAEIMYGLKSSVPAFSFFDQEDQKIFRMYDMDCALKVQQRLAQSTEALLKDGSSYSNVYSGGASETHFCAVDLGWDKLWKNIKVGRAILLGFINIHRIIRIILRIIFELIYSIKDFIHGILTGNNFQKEFNFILTRLSICILLRNFIAYGARIDTIRGLPIIYLNFLGYDEHAHRRGNASRFAFSTLRGIDNRIAKIYYQAMHSTRRNYDVWIFSDHGQQTVESYFEKYSKSVQQAVREVFDEFTVSEDFLNFVDQESERFHRARYLGERFFKKISPFKVFQEKQSDKNNLVVTAMGPLGHVYLPKELTLDEKDKFAKKLINEANIPLVLFPLEDNRVKAWTKEGIYYLPENAQEVLGADHPYLNEVTKDLINTCHLPNAGTFTICGWRPNQKPMSFPIESGAHGGPGSEETEGFVLLPSDISLIKEDKNYIRPLDVRNAAFTFLQRQSKDQKNEVLFKDRLKQNRILRIMTYNVHSCKGMDGKVSIERIARVIARHEPDIVALQEVDMHRPRTGKVNQPREIAKYLEMMYHFHPSIKIAEENYGNVILSRFPMQLMAAKPLLRIQGVFPYESRAVIWTVVDVGGIKIQFFNTHLGVRLRESYPQAQSLLTNEWLNHPLCIGPTIFCGDLNASINSKTCQVLLKKLKDAQSQLEGHNPKATWFGHFPIKRIDHVFISDDFEVLKIKVSHTGLDKLASDHLPLIVDLKLK